jgi:hypothetical protein
MNCGTKFWPNDKDNYLFVNKLIRLIVLRFRHEPKTTMDPLPLRALLVFDDCSNGGAPTWRAPMPELPSPVTPGAAAHRPALPDT